MEIKDSKPGNVDGKKVLIYGPHPDKPQVILEIETVFSVSQDIKTHIPGISIHHDLALQSNKGPL